MSCAAPVWRLTRQLLCSWVVHPKVCCGVCAGAWPAQCLFLLPWCAGACQTWQEGDRDDHSWGNHVMLTLCVCLSCAAGGGPRQPQLGQPRHVYAVSAPFARGRTWTATTTAGATTSCAPTRACTSTWPARGARRRSWSACSCWWTGACRRVRCCRVLVRVTCKPCSPASVLRNICCLPNCSRVSYHSTRRCQAFVYGPQPVCLSERVTSSALPLSCLFTQLLLALCHVPHRAPAQSSTERCRNQACLSP